MPTLLFRSFQYLMILCLSTLFVTVLCSAQQSTTGSKLGPGVRGPQEGEYSIPPGTALAQIRETYEKRRTTNLFPADQEDKSPLPEWFRKYLRDQLRLTQSGLYQYPRVAEQVFDWMLAHPNLDVAQPSEGIGRSVVLATGTVGDVNITSFDERNSESSVAIDYANPQYLIAASNNIKTSGRQKQFYSSDGGKTWKATELPLAEGKALHSDPAVAFASDGAAWAATIGINNTGSSLQIQTYKSIDHGATWSFVATISAGSNNDKEMMVIDAYPTSPYKDHIYIAWDVPGQGVRFSYSTDRGATWSRPASLSTDSAIGVHLATGPQGELYIGWPDVTSRNIFVRRSADGGKTFGPAQKIAQTSAAYEITIPPMCRRNALIYLSLGVDRSTSSRKGRVYAAWTDLDGQGQPGCNGNSGSTTGNASIHLSYSNNGGTTWSSPRPVGPAKAHVDHFNQWLDVDPEDGSLYVLYYSTSGDNSRHSTNVYLAKSSDGQDTWSETKLSSASTDETESTADQGNQYGDYNGLVAYKTVVHGTWTDRRTGVPGSKEQIFTNAPTADPHTTEAPAKQ
jgi:hypothetical protein